ncbi:PREDICTED: uncharacterized protein LOC104585995 isoform X2 [Nelumbo nucifera]|uniref:Uncharacterized protein LOC104585995 isoform X2 n=1 Tax=Nelumbo nucifera TaxID=4432 RepID=A0A1U7Z2C6_NELNU|nr:PREDICTED: uncharacterized protein LOC104585995 isoform X2 [Nelumbo nucifera]
MACQAIRSWTFCGLVGAFLDLALAYLLLCGSALAFFASKFLGIFGLYLPCPCNGFFGVPNGGKCLQRLLVDCPTGKISSVQMSVKSKFPFDTFWMKDQGCQLNVKLLRDRDRCDGLLEMEGEASCSSFSETRRRSHSLALRDLSPRNEMIRFGLTNSPVARESRSDVKGKGVVTQKPRSTLRRRRRSAVEHGKFSSVSSSDPPRFNCRNAPRSPYSVSETGHEINEESSEPVNYGGDGLNDDRGVSRGIGLGEGKLHGFEQNDPFGESKSMEEGGLLVEELVCHDRNELDFDGKDANAIRVLEQALEEEQAARAALYVELEKERSAAATAADEAMAMILRLQKEKASIEMEARQYQRMIEEKSAYDAEEMDILKEILIRREREKHFLEKEVESYRQVVLARDEKLQGNKHDLAEMLEQKPTFPFDFSGDPVLMLHQISESIGKKEIMKNTKKPSDSITLTMEELNSNHVSLEHPTSVDWDDDADFLKRGNIQRKVGIDKYYSQVRGSMDEFNQEFQEKGMVSMDKNPSAPNKDGAILEADASLHKLNSPQEHGLLDKTIILIDENQRQKDNPLKCQGMGVKGDQGHTGNGFTFHCDSEALDKHGKDTGLGYSHVYISMQEKEASPHDVHIIDDNSKGVSRDSRKYPLSFGDPSGDKGIYVVSDCASMGKAEIEPDIHRSSSNMTSGRMPPANDSHGKALPLFLWRNSKSAADSERWKIENEVEWLRERLRIVQEGREKLNFSVDYREKEQLQLQLLEDIVTQLREIWQLKEPGRAARQASLPPSSSKVSSKKRRCRSLSCGLHEST